MVALEFSDFSPNLGRWSGEGKQTELGRKVGIFRKRLCQPGTEDVVGRKNSDAEEQGFRLRTEEQSNSKHSEETPTNPETTVSNQQEI
jgi:hypothetical protein